MLLWRASRRMVLAILMSVIAAGAMLLEMPTSTTMTLTIFAAFSFFFDQSLIKIRISKHSNERDVNEGGRCVDAVWRDGKHMQGDEGCVQRERDDGSNGTLIHWMAVRLLVLLRLSA